MPLASGGDSSADHAGSLQRIIETIPSVLLMIHPLMMPQLAAMHF
jgi:hypothetical protein